MLDTFFFSNGPIRVVQRVFGEHPEVFHWLALLGDTWGMMLVLGVAFWWFGRDSAYALVGALALGALTKMLLSMAFDVPRPSGPGITVYQEVDLSSFPSGHVYQITIPWLLLWTRERLPWVLPAAVVLTVAVARLCLGVHYLGDVVFAAVFAALFVWGYRPLFAAVRPWFARRSARFWLLATLAGGGAVLLTILFWVDTGRRWEVLGLVVGAGLAALAERRWVGYTPPDARAGRVRVLGLGLLGLAAFALLMRTLSNGGSAALHFSAAFGMICWVLLAVPALARHVLPTA